MKGHGDDLREALRRPAAHPWPVTGEVEVVETHISWIFLADEDVVKVKKPVSLGFLDFSTPELRRHFCEEEVRLNRRLAPGVHHGVVPITREADASLRIRGAGSPVEWAVHMRRLPREGMLDALLERGAIDNERLERVARLLADFHRDARGDQAVREHGAFDVVARNTLENFEQTAPWVGEPAAGAASVSERCHAFLRERAARRLAALHGLMRRRVEEGRIREGHGDLHAGNICWFGDRLVVYDRIEFSERFRCLDVASDLAFLTMDLDARGYRGFSDYLARRYCELAGDPDARRLLPFYEEYRALVRAKVACIASADEGLSTERREERRLEGARYFQLAAAYGLPPALVLLCGLPGSGKSWLARRIARPFEAAIFQSDRIRKQTAGLPPTARPTGAAAEELYGRERTDAVYAELLRRSLDAVGEGRTAIADANFPTRELRQRFRSAAERAGIPCFVLWARPGEALVRRRLEARAADQSEVSDAGWEVYLRARERFEEPREAPFSLRVETTTEEPAEHVAGRLIDRMIASAPPAGAPDRDQEPASGGE